MRYRLLGHSRLRVSKASVGTMTFGAREIRMEDVWRSLPESGGCP